MPVSKFKKTSATTRKLLVKRKSSGSQKISTASKTVKKKFTCAMLASGSSKRSSRKKQEDRILTRSMIEKYKLKVPKICPNSIIALEQRIQVTPKKQSLKVKSTSLRRHVPTRWTRTLKNCGRPHVPVITRSKAQLFDDCRRSLDRGSDVVTRNWCHHLSDVIALADVMSFTRKRFGRMALDDDDNHGKSGRDRRRREEVDDDAGSRRIRSRSPLTADQPEMSKERKLRLQEKLADPSLCGLTGQRDNWSDTNSESEDETARWTGKPFQADLQKDVSERIRDSSTENVPNFEIQKERWSSQQEVDGRQNHGISNPVENVNPASVLPKAVEEFGPPAVKPFAAPYCQGGAKLSTALNRNNFFSAKNYIAKRMSSSINPENKPNPESNPAGHPTGDCRSDPNQCSYKELRFSSCSSPPFCKSVVVPDEGNLWLPKQREGSDGQEKVDDAIPTEQIGASDARSTEPDELTKSKERCVFKSMGFKTKVAKRNSQQEQKKSRSHDLQMKARQDITNRFRNLTTDSEKWFDDTISDGEDIAFSVASRSAPVLPSKCGTRTFQLPASEKTGIDISLVKSAVTRAIPLPFKKSEANEIDTSKSLQNQNNSPSPQISGFLVSLKGVAERFREYASKRIMHFNRPHDAVKYAIKQNEQNLSIDYTKRVISDGELGTNGVVRLTTVPATNANPFAGIFGEFPSTNAIVADNSNATACSQEKTSTCIIQNIHSKFLNHNVETSAGKNWTLSKSNIVLSESDSSTHRLRTAQMSTCEQSFSLLNPDRVNCEFLRFDESIAKKNNEVSCV